jgi:hypothetical protein
MPTLLDLFIAGLMFGLGFTIAWCVVSFAWTELVQKVRR